MAELPRYKDSGGSGQEKCGFCADHGTAERSRSFPLLAPPPVVFAQACLTLLVNDRVSLLASAPRGSVDAA